MEEERGHNTGGIGIEGGREAGKGLDRVVGARGAKTLGVLESRGRWGGGIDMCWVENLSQRALSFQCGVNWVIIYLASTSAC